MMGDWSRLLIRTDRPDTAEMLACWEWLVGPNMRPLVMTMFGDWFLVDQVGRVHWLDLLEGSCSKVAESVVEWQQLTAQEEHQDSWFMLPWCERLFAEGLVPGDGQCFGFKVPPKLGAPVELSNVEVANLIAYQAWMAEIAKLPPGTLVGGFTVNGELP
jgi:hypothetical protein